MEPPPLVGLIGATLWDVCEADACHDAYIVVCPLFPLLPNLLALNFLLGWA